jgi:hypothetical protein
MAVVFVFAYTYASEPIEVLILSLNNRQEAKIAIANDMSESLFRPHLRNSRRVQFQGRKTKFLVLCHVNNTRHDADTGEKPGSSLFGEIR